MTIKINNSLDSAVKEGKWSNPGIALYDKLSSEENWQSLLEEAYLITPNGSMWLFDDNHVKKPFSRSGCKYPHHIIKNGELVVSIPGVQAAYSRAKQQGIFSGEVKKHLEKHYKELNLYDKSSMKDDETIKENFDMIESFLDNQLNIDLSVPTYESMESNLKTRSSIEELNQWIDEAVHPNTEVKDYSNEYKINLFNESNGSKLFIASDKNLDGYTMYPLVPYNYLTKNGYADKKTKRVVMYTSIDGALMGTNRDISDCVMNIYSPNKNYDYYKPTKEEMPSANLTGEVWIKEPVKLVKIGSIQILNRGKKYEYKYGIGKRGIMYKWKHEKMENAHTVSTKGNINESSEFESIKDNFLGVCNDIAWFVHKWFKKNKIKHDVFYMKINRVNKPAYIHTFVIYYEEDKFKIFEGSMVKHKGIYEFDSFDDAIDKMIELNKKEYPDVTDGDDIDIYKFKSEPKYGLNKFEYDKFGTSQEKIKIKNKSKKEENVNESVETNEIAKITDPKDLLKWMNCIRWGWVDKFGKEHPEHPSEDSDFMNNYALQDVNQIVKNKMGMCWDQAELARTWFKDNGYHPKVYYIELQLEPNYPTHSFVVYKEDDSWIWFEHSWSKYRGIHKYSSLDKLLADVKKKHIAEEKDKDASKEAKVIIRDVTNIKPGVNGNDYYAYAHKQKEVEINLDQEKSINEMFDLNIFNEEESKSVTDLIRDQIPDLDDIAKKELENETKQEEPKNEEEPPKLDDIERDEPKEEEKPEEKKEEEESLPKQADKEESPKNGVRRKKLYIAFIEFAKRLNSKNTFGSMFDKEAFHVVYPFVPEEMRYFYRLANPLLCVLADNLTFFQLSNLRKVNAQNPKLDEMMIFAGTETEIIVFNKADKKIYKGVLNNNNIELKEAIGETFDLYIQKMVNQGDILNAPITEALVGYVLL